MDKPDSYPVLVTKACATFIADVGLAVYAPERAYTPAEIGVVINGDMPTTRDNAVILNTLRPIADGRANLIVPVQFRARLKGSRTTAINFAADLFALFDQRENRPGGLFISWSYEFSRVDLGQDTQGRAEVSSTFHFRGRRPLG